MANILIASLGESPIVVTSMVKALKEEKSIEVDKVIVVYPAEHPNIKDGIDLIEKHCLCRKIEPCGLPFPDVNSYRRCYLFLQTLYGLLEANQQDTVYLSIAGGRKTMSALMYLFAPFYENIKGVYHILDTNEGTDRKNFHSLEELLNRFCSDDPKLEDIMNPPSDELNLIEIPFEHFANVQELRELLKNYDPKQLTEGVSISLDDIEPDALDFWTAVFQKREAPKRNILNIRFSQTAYEQYFELEDNLRKVFRKYFRQMQSPNFIDQKKHGTFSGNGAVFHFSKLRQTGERPFFYRQGKDVIVAQLTYKANDSYQQLSNKLQKYRPSVSEYEPKYTLKEIEQIGDILLAAVGESPMVVTQAYRLLQRKENANIDKIAVVFPEQNTYIKTGIRILEDVFGKKAEVIKCGAALKDLNSEDACEDFLNRIIKAVEDLKKNYPDSEIRMLLSGGRKGMSALSYLAAQRSNITKVYHTLITDSELEDKIKSECSIENLNRLGSTKKKAEKMFLECYPAEKFDLFEVPVISLGR